jgi:hypothetical protein
MGFDQGMDPGETGKAYLREKSIEMMVGMNSGISGQTDKSDLCHRFSVEGEACSTWVCRNFTQSPDAVTGSPSSNWVWLFQFISDVQPEIFY